MEFLINPHNPEQVEARERAHRPGTYHVVPRELYLAAQELEDTAQEIDRMATGLAETYLASFQMGIIGEKTHAREKYNQSVDKVLAKLRLLVQAGNEGARIMHSVAAHYVAVDDQEYANFGHLDPGRLAPPGSHPPPPSEDLHY